MILNQAPKQNVFSSVESSQPLSMSMSPKDQAVLIDLQINKLYKNKIRAAIQEYISNARDANVDAGNSQCPIRVFLPTQETPTFSVSDDGFGMSPELVKNYICVLGASTKRDNNNCIGAYGLGVKCGYAYIKDNGQQFSITTVYEGNKYSYLLHYDQDGLPMVSLLDTVQTTEPSGTTVTIPVSSHDISTFFKEAYRILQYWIGVYPVVIENESSFNNKLSKIDGLVYSCDEFDIYRTNQRYYNNIVVIGGIPYDVNFNQPINSYNFTIVAKVKIGVLDIVPSREFLEDTNNNSNILGPIFEKANAQIVLEYQNKVDECQSEEEVFQKFYRDTFTQRMCKYKDNEIQFGHISNFFHFYFVGHFPKELPSSYKVVMSDVKNENAEKIRYNFKDEHVIVLKRSIKSNYRWGTTNFLKDESNFTEFEKNLISQLTKTTVEYSSLKNIPRKRSEKVQEPTCWKLNSRRFVPQFDDVAEISGAFFEGANLKPVDDSAKLVLFKSDADWYSNIEIPNIYMIPKRSMEKAKKNSKLKPILDAAKECLVTDKNIKDMNSTVMNSIFGPNFFRYVLHGDNRKEIKDSLIVEFVNKCSLANSHWSGRGLTTNSSLISLYYKIFNKEYTTPELDLFRTKYTVCSKVNITEGNGQSMLEIVNYIHGR